MDDVTTPGICIQLKVIGTVGPFLKMSALSLPSLKVQEL
jgi:hypothetical protein